MLKVGQIDILMRQELLNFVLWLSFQIRCGHTHLGGKNHLNSCLIVMYWLVV